MAEKIVIAKLDLDSKDLVKSAVQTKEAINQIKQAQKELDTTTKEGAEQYVKNEAQLKKLSSEYRTQSNAISQLITTNGDLLKTTDALNIAIDKDVNSITNARQNIAELTKVRNELNLKTKEGQDALVLINSKIDDNNKFIKDNSSELEKQKIGIGGYTQSIKDALKETGLFNGGLTQFGTAGKVAEIGFKMIKTEVDNAVSSVKNSTIGFGANTTAKEVNTISTISNTTATQTRTTVGFQSAGVAKAETTAIESMTAAQKISTLATNGSSGALKLFRIALISTGIGAIVVALGSLIAFLSSTQKGIDLVTSVTRPLSALFGVFFGQIQKVGEALFDAFTNPKKTLSDLADFVKNNLINRFKAFGVILDGIVNLDFKKVADGVLQAGTGVENLTTKIKNTANATGQLMTEALNKGKRIDDLQKEIERNEIDIITLRAETERDLLKQEEIIKNTSKSTAERNQAIKEQERLLKKLVDAENNILDKNIEVLKIKQSLNDTSREEEKKLKELEADRIKNEDKIQQNIVKNQRVLNSIRNDEESKRKDASQKAEAERQKRVENAIKESQDFIRLFQAETGFKALELEKQAENEKKLVDKRLALLEQERKAGKKSKTEYEAEKLEITNEYLKRQAEITTEFARRELDEFISSSQTLIDKNKFISEQLVIEEKARFEALAQARKDFENIQFENGLITFTEYQNNIAKIDEEFYLKKQETEALRKAQETEALNLELENKRAVEDLLFANDLQILSERLEQKRLLEVANAEKIGADVSNINKKYAIAQRQLELKSEMAKVQGMQNALNDIGGLLNAFGVKNKNLSIALAFADAFLGAQKAYLSQLSIPTIDAPARAVIAGAKALAFGLGNVARISQADTKFEKGGLMEIGGRRHSQGGTKFVGSDGTRFEAEKGELIGVLNRSASDAFMNFNNQYGNGAVGITHAQNGGIIARSTSRANEIESIALLTAEIVRNQPPPIVTVEDINTVATRVSVIENGAEF